MRKRVYSWLGREFVELSGEAPEGRSAEEETRALLSQFADELKVHGLSLENTVRTRLWARSRTFRVEASKARGVILTGNASASSSSYISAPHFDSKAKAALDLLALRPSTAAAERIPVQFEPPRAYLRYLRNDSLIFISGFTSGDGGLKDQVPRVLADIDATLAAAGTSWSRVVRLSAFLSRSQKLETLQTLLSNANRAEVPQLEFGAVDGFAGETSLLEVEVTAEVV
ncbi:MAG: hypothetical protein GTO40_02170 [Deltaproteobacteria bacterium]|nr:hypothetical protein [Deltaproteobacteria bacterium]